MLKQILLIIICCFILLCNVESKEIAYLNFKTNDFAKNKSVIKKYGATKIHMFPPNEFVFEIDENAFKELQKKYDCILDSKDKSIQTSNSIANKVYNYLISEGQMQVNKLLSPDTVSPSPTLTCGAKTIYIEEPSNYKSSDFLFPDRKDMFTANYMIGDVAVCII